MRKSIFVTAFAVLALTAASAAFAAKNSGEFASFAAKDIDGNEVTQEVLAKAELTVMNVWGTFCGPCLREMPALGKLASEYKDKNVQFIGVVIDVLDRNGGINDKQVEKARGLVAKTGAAYLHLLPSKDLMDAKLAAIYAIPETYFVDAGGRILDSVTGAMAEDQWRTKIESVLAEMKK